MRVDDTPGIYGAYPVTLKAKPEIPSEKRTCKECGCEVWIDRNMLEFADTCSIVCLTCLAKDHDLSEVRVHPKQLHSIEGYERRN